VRILGLVVALLLVAGGYWFAVRPADDSASTAAAATPVPTPPAQQVVYVFGGRGFGHGVGLPQYGARGAARAGWDAARILGYYYPGISVQPMPTREVRVLVAEGRATLAASRDRAWRAVGEAGGPSVALAAGAGYRLRPAEGGVTVADAAGREVARFPGPVVLEALPLGGSRRLAPAPRPGGAIALDGVVYRGRIRVVPRGDLLDAVNHVGLEEYLLGVVPKEMPPAWGDDAPAALQAQAIAARTYALANLEPGRDWDLHDDQRSQVYGGRAVEDPRTTAAVEATAGQVATYEGRPIEAFFSASSGGRTEEGRNVFPDAGDAPYLASVTDPFDDSSPYHRWSEPLAFDAGRLADLLDLPGQVAAIDVVRRGGSPRVLEARVTTAWPFSTRHEVTGSTLRAALELPDTWFWVTRRALDARGRAVAPPAGGGRDQVWLAVLNGSGSAGLAARVAERAEALGYRAVTAANAPLQTEPSTAYYRPGAEAAAERVARDLDVPRTALLPPDPALVAEAPAGAQVVVVLSS